MKLKIIDLIIVFTSSFIITGIVSKNTGNKYITTAAFVFAFIACILSFQWWYRKQVKNQKSGIPGLLPLPSADIGKLLAGDYQSKLTSSWSDSDGNNHIYTHPGYLSLYRDGSATSGQFFSDMEGSSYSAGKWHASYDDNNEIEMKLLMKKIKNGEYDPFFDIDHEELKEMKYGGRFIEASDYIGNGYYLGKVTEEGILIHGQIFKKIVKSG